ncbi:MAG: hypothetical protein Fur0042_05170 [Cyanophyceae cyanobacterium]
MNQGKIAGIFTERDVVRLLSYQLNLDEFTLESLMSKEVVALKLCEVKDIFQISQIFKRHRIRHIPVLDNRGKLVGVITPESVRSQIRPEHLLRYIRASEVAINNVIKSSAHESLLTVSRKLVLHRVSCLVVVDDLSQRPVGIVTERDMVRLRSLDLNFEVITVRTAMSQPIITASPSDSLWAIHQQMQDHKVRRLPLVKSNGALAGLVTQTQMLELLNPSEIYQVMRQMQATIDRQTADLKQLNRTLKATNEELRRLVSIDELTQIHNRRSLNHHLEKEWRRALREQLPIAFILCDVDEFKAYNDTYGHGGGDECLLQVAQTLKRGVTRSHDLVARYGGEEFAILLPETDLVGAKRVARSLLTAINTLALPHGGSHVAPHLTISLGVVAVPQAQHTTLDAMLSEADRLLYCSKARGRNTYTAGVLGPTIARSAPPVVPLRLQDHGPVAPAVAASPENERSPGEVSRGHS